MQLVAKRQHRLRHIAQFVSAIRPDHRDAQIARAEFAHRVGKGANRADDVADGHHHKRRRSENPKQHDQHQRDHRDRANARPCVGRLLGIGRDRVRRFRHRRFKGVELIEKPRKVGPGPLRIGLDPVDDLRRGRRIGFHRRDELAGDRGDLG
ncbi:hypothetical protein D9M73_167930 [compost metagenome]